MFHGFFGWTAVDQKSSPAIWSVFHPPRRKSETWWRNPSKPAAWQKKSGCQGLQNSYVVDGSEIRLTHQLRLLVHQFRVYLIIYKFFLTSQVVSSRCSEQIIGTLLQVMSSNASLWSQFFCVLRCTPRKANMSPENQWFEWHIPYFE